ncbi:MAG: glutaminyl-peptide cyclotransferase [Acidobacteria bacterium]|nr:glutaminyl-peptide cyclotransferase [Acidobacteriota bacterium]
MLVAPLVATLVAPTCEVAPTGRETAPGLQLGYEIVGEYPHDYRAFTQGLFWHAGYLYEGTGQRGESQLRKVDIKTGEVTQQVSLDNTIFGEGIALLDGRIFQLSWLAKRGFIYDVDSFELLGEFHYDTQGWGLTTDGRHLIMSDGSEHLSFLDADTLQVVRTLRVYEDGRGVRNLNELEYIDGLLYANVWHSDDILRIDPDSGEVVDRIDFSGLMADRRPADSEAVLNGIAYNSNNGHLYVTGKRWPKLFEIRLVTR